jgi:hypothetical protein
MLGVAYRIFQSLATKRETRAELGEVKTIAQSIEARVREQNGRIGKLEQWKSDYEQIGEYRVEGLKEKLDDLSDQIGTIAASLGRKRTYKKP